jgi:hypothetical protein
MKGKPIKIEPNYLFNSKLTFLSASGLHQYKHQTVQAQLQILDLNYKTSNLRQKFQSDCLFSFSGIIFWNLLTLLKVWWQSQPNLLCIIDFFTVIIPSIGYVNACTYFSIKIILSDDNFRFE